ncbi:MAG: hypothetical protein ACRC5M_06820 [Anaeroplasmataceae bacterium]
MAKRIDKAKEELILLLKEQSLEMDKKLDGHGISIEYVDRCHYMKMKHPVVKNQTIYVSGNTVFLLTSLINDVNYLINETRKSDEELERKLNDIILILHKIDNENRLKPYNYHIEIKNKIVYIL